MDFEKRTWKEKKTTFDWLMYALMTFDQYESNYPIAESINEISQKDEVIVIFIFLKKR